MKTTYFLFCLLLAGVINAQKFPTDTLLKSGRIDNRVAFVFVGDGYKDAEQNKFVTDVQTVLDKMFTKSPYKEYKNYFNIYLIKVPSVESGAKHPGNSSDNACAGVPVASPNNYFGSSFDAGGGSYHRLLVANDTKVATVITSNFPKYDQGFVLVNSPYYGGAGGTIAVSSTEASSAEISIHEIGHSFGALADEYWAGPQYAGEYANMTAAANQAACRWNIWIDTDAVGFFPFTEDTKWKRPHQSCEMRLLGNSFCRVCAEAILLKVFTLVNCIDSYTPSNASTIPAGTADINFKLNLIVPNPNTLSVRWKLDGTNKASNVDALTLKNADLTNGTHQLVATVLDTTPQIRAANHQTLNLRTVQWNISKTSSITDISSVSYETIVNVYPNPFADELNFDYQIDKTAQIKLELTDLNGRLVKVIDSGNKEAGEHKARIITSDLNLAEGLYFVNLSINGTVVLSKQVIRTN